MTERKLKSRILIFMLISKIAVIFFILFHWRTGGYSLSEMIATITLIVPLFTVYLTVIIKDTVKNPYKEQEHENENRKVKSSITILTHITFPLYLIVILYLISLKPRPGAFTFENLQTSIAAIESGFGIYLGQIVFTLFQKNK